MFEKMSATATGVTTYGMSTPIRQKVLARRFWSSTAAMKVAAMICGTLESRKMLIVLNSEFQKSSSWSSLTKLPKPTHWPGPLSRFQSLSETTKV
jgi:hypothetical protein